MSTKRRIARISHARPSFFEGMARVMDIGGTLNQCDADDLIRIHRALRARRLAEPSGIEAETEAIRKVWDDVGGCIHDAMGGFSREKPEKLRSETRFLSTFQ